MPWYVHQPRPPPTSARDRCVPLDGSLRWGSAGPLLCFSHTACCLPPSHPQIGYFDCEFSHSHKKLSLPTGPAHTPTHWKVSYSYKIGGPGMGTERAIARAAQCGSSCRTGRYPAFAAMPRHGGMRSLGLQQTVFYLKEVLTMAVGEKMRGQLTCSPNAENHRYVRYATLVLHGCHRRAELPTTVPT
jgi:hypothetical protein